MFVFWGKGVTYDIFGNVIASLFKGNVKFVKFELFLSLTVWCLLLSKNAIHLVSTPTCPGSTDKFAILAKYTTLICYSNAHTCVCNVIRLSVNAMTNFTTVYYIYSSNVSMLVTRL